jgi:hypothetical protein
MNDLIRPPKAWNGDKINIYILYDPLLFHIFPYKVYLLLVQELLQASQAIMDVKTLKNKSIFHLQ